MSGEPGSEDVETGAGVGAEAGTGEEASAQPTGDPHSTGFLLGSAALAIAAVIAVILIRPLFDDERKPVKRFGSKVLTERVKSDALDRTLPVRVVVPERAPGEKRKLVVFLHGRGDNERSYLYEEMFKALAREDGKAPIFAFPRGGSSSYWHDRDDGDWGTYVLEDLVPALRKRFKVVKRLVSIGGISMGGFGAYNLAVRAPQSFCSVGGHSPALWQRAGDTAEGAFDDAEDFNEHNVLRQVGPPDSPLAGKPAWIDVGEDDPFRDVDELLAERLRAGGAEVEFRTFPGDHEASYWRDHWRAYARFYTRTLSSCEDKSG